MRPWDPDDPGTSPQEWRAQLAAYRAELRSAAQRQAAARRALDSAEERAEVLAGWAARVGDAAARLRAQSAALAANAAALVEVEDRLSRIEGDLGERRESRDTATARLLGAQPLDQPIVLLPLRLETSWDGDRLRVRIYPDEIGVDRHDPRLTPDEASAGAAYWATRDAPGEPDGAPARAEQAWRDLVRLTDAQRAAWIVRRTGPGSTPPAAGDLRDSAWDVEVHARLLPARFAVVAFADGEPIDLAESAYVTWSAAVADPLPISTLQESGTADRSTDFAAALREGMAVELIVPAGAPPIEELVVVGVREAAGAGLADLLRAHAYSLGLEVMADGTPTNNSAEVRAAHSPARESAVAAALTRDDSGQAGAAPGDGTAAAALADALGLDRVSLIGVTGAGAGRNSLVGAVSRVVDQALGRSPADELRRPGGPVPALRVGRQPYGVLPITAPSRWIATDGGSGEDLDRVAHRFAVPLDVDPLDPPAVGATARQVRAEDVSTLDAVLDESPASLAWSAPAVLDPDGTTRPGPRYEGEAGLLGAADGDGAPHSYLGALATVADAELAGIAATLPDTLLARLAVAARRAASGGPQAGPVSAALATLSVVAETPDGRADLVRVLAQELDAVSSRPDVAATAVVSGRLASMRRSAPRADSVLGGYGYLTDVRPRTQPRSFGHVHAPSLGHAATAAVLRAGYLGQRKAAWAAKVLAAERAIADGATRSTAELDAARVGLATLAPLDDATEARMPLAIDLSSRRVRDARWVLAAVRAGQPLAAVLGYQVERDLADRGLQRYLAAVRKLTRFRTGTALEALEEARRAARQRVTDDEEHLAGLQQTAEQAAERVRAARAALSRARSRADAAAALAQPVLVLQAESTGLDSTTIPRLRSALARIDAARPEPTVERRTVQVP